VDTNCIAVQMVFRSMWNRTIYYRYEIDKDVYKEKQKEQVQSKDTTWPTQHKDNKLV
jgi:hypothetical protein